jgi:dipeptidyl aminopeptidase/acylaminoacyl peptidase
MMTRNYLRAVLLAQVLLNSPGLAASHVERGALSFDNIPDAPPGFADTLEGYLGARQATPLNWSPKGQLLMSTRFGEVEQLHVLDRPDGERHQITFLNEPIIQGAFSPDPGRNAFFYLKDVGGNGNLQLYYQRQGTSGPKLLTDGKSMNGGALWSNAGREIAFFSTARDGVSIDIDVVDPEAGTLPRLVVTGDAAAWSPVDWSPDDRKLLVLKTVSIAEGYLYVVDLNTGEKREVEPSSAKAGIAGARFSRDGQGVYLISDRDGEFAKLRYVNLFTGDKSLISAGIPWDIEDLAVSRDGHFLAFVSNEGGVGRLNVTDLRAHQDLTPPRLPFPGVIDHLSFDAEGRRLAFGYAAANHPRDVYVLNLANNQVEAWTHSETGAVDPARFVIPHLVEFPTFDRQETRTRQIPAYVYEPMTPGRHPVLILVHGGPESQFRPRFDPWIQYVVGELGFAVVAPNVRGSSGYGKTYLALDNGTLRDDAVKDMGALIVWLGLQGNFDAKHIVVAGSGYGGYLALAALVNYGDRLVGGVDVAGFGDFISFLSGIPPYAQTPRRAEYGDERDIDMRAYLRRISPLTNADRIARPLLVVQGRQDPQVPFSESEQIVNRLRGRGIDVWYLKAANEGTEFQKQQNREAYYLTFAQFLAKYGR